MTRSSRSSVVGIDLGTTNSLAAYVEDGRPAAVRDSSGRALVPSCISFHPDGSVLVGSAARDRALVDPQHTVLSIKRLMGRSLAELAEELPHIPQAIMERDAGGGRKVVCVRIGEKEYTPEELSAMILKEVRARAGNPTRAVITVPAYFDDSQRQATRDAGRIAGLDVLRIVNEPTAAALAYGLDRKGSGTVAVYDLGGGTFDCSILSLHDGVFKVLSTHGHTHLGGDDFDRLIMEMIPDSQETLPTNEHERARRLQQLRTVAEDAKIALSHSESAEMMYDGRGVKITREMFNKLIEPLVSRTIDQCRAALRDANLNAKQIDEVVLVGGSTRIPYVRKRVEQFFGRPPHTDVNPDEVVALGAAIQADILAGGSKGILLLDVVPLSLGIETLGGVVDKLIDRNTTVPCRATSRYTTFQDGQTAIRINIYQGERELTKDCHRLGEFVLSGIPPMPAQLPQVDVTFLVDADGLLTVTAVEQRSGQKASVEVRAAHGLTQDEVERLVLESVDHAQADFTARRLIEFCNKADADLRHATKALAQVGETLTDEQRVAVDRATEALKQAMAGTDVDALHRAVDAFGQATEPLAEALMSATAKALLAGKREDQIADVN